MQQLKSLAAQAAPLSQPAALQSRKDLTFGITQASSEDDKQQSRREEINSVAQEGCLRQFMEEHHLKPLQYALPQLSLHAAAPAWSSHLLRWRKLPQFCTKISPRQKTPSPHPTAVFSSPRTWLSPCLRLHIHEVRPQLRRQGSPARACRPHFSISIALHFYSFIPARQICTAPLLIYWGSPL